MPRRLTEWKVGDVIEWKYTTWTFSPGHQAIGIVVNVLHSTIWVRWVSAPRDLYFSHGMGDIYFTLDDAKTLNFTKITEVPDVQVQS
jgi:hypothetical protein